MRNKISKSIMFYYDSLTQTYKALDDVTGGGINKFIPKVELYWYDESNDSYKPLVTDGTLPLSGDGGSFDPSLLSDYAKKTYVNDSISILETYVGNIYATKSYVVTEIENLNLEEMFLKKSDALALYASNSSIGDLSQLTTTDKTNLVNAINEVKISGAGGTGGGSIDLSGYATKNELDNKVDKVEGKILSTNDYTTTDKDKLAGIENNANNYTLPTSSSTVLGGVKIQANSGLEVTAGGTLSATTLKNTVDAHVTDDIKHITATERTKWNTVGTVSELSTTNKTDLVKAINEVKSQITTSSSASTFINVKDYGAEGDGITDDTTAIQNAITYARTNKNVVIFPQGRYKTTGTLTIYTGVILKGLSTEGSIIEYAGADVAVKFDYDQRDMAIETITIQSTNSATTTIGVLMESNLFCNIDTVRVLDFGIGYKLDGKDKWCATNYIYNPFALRCKTGILLTADEGKQTNHTIVIGGYIVGYSPIQEDTKAVVIEQGDSNKFFGTAVEDYAVGYHFISENAGGNSLISPRVENCTKSYIVEPNTVNTTIIDPFGGIEEADIQSSSIMFLSSEPTFVANNLIWENDKGIKAYSSGRTPWEVFKVTMNDGLEFLAPSYFDSNIEFKIADELNMHQSELTIKQNEVKIRKYLNHGRTNNLPIADETQRGKEIFVEGSTGESDKLVVCVKKDDGTYTWEDSLNSLDSHVTDSVKHITVAERTKCNTVGTVANLKTTTKTDLVSAMNELFTNVSDGKSSLATAITAKGQNVTGDSTFAELTSAINNISTQNIASGSGVLVNHIATVSGLSFRPKIIIIKGTDGVEPISNRFYIENGDYPESYTKIYRNKFGMFSTVVNYGSSAFQINDSGFSVRLDDYSNSTAFAFSWVAV